MYSEKEIIRKVESLAEKIGKLEVVQDYHNVEKQIHNNQAIKLQMMVKTMEDRLNEYNKKEHNE